MNNKMKVKRIHERESPFIISCSSFSIPSVAHVPGSLSFSLPFVCPRWKLRQLHMMTVNNFHLLTLAGYSPGPHISLSLLKQQ